MPRYRPPVVGLFYINLSAMRLHGVRTEGMTREAALAEMQTILERRVSQGDLVFMEFAPKLGVMAIAGKYRDDPTLREICEQAYQDRDAGGAE